MVGAYTGDISEAQEGRELEKSMMTYAWLGNVIDTGHNPNEN